MNVSKPLFLNKALPVGLVLLLVTALFWSRISLADTPGGGFEPGDPCGYVMGGGPGYSDGTVDFQALGNDQACLDSTGLFYEGGGQQSYGRYTLESGDSYTFDFAPTVAPEDLPAVNMTTGEVTGMAKFTNLPEGTPEDQSWLDFNWVCTPEFEAQLAPTYTCEDWAPKINLQTGMFTGAAWSDYFDTYLVFGVTDYTGIQVELPINTVQMIVDIFANESENGPNDVDLTNAPMADGYSYWRVRVRLLDVFTGEYIGEDKIQHLSLDLVSYDEMDDVPEDDPNYALYPPSELQGSDLGVRLNTLTALRPARRAILEEWNHPAIEECKDIDTDLTEFCLRTEDGIDGYNIFVSSGAPTANMTGVVNTDGSQVDELGARPGCVEFYTGDTSEACPIGGLWFPEKDQVFFDRREDVNQYLVNYLKVELRFNDGLEYQVLTYDNRDSGGDALLQTADYMPDYLEFAYIPVEAQKELSWRPRIKVRDFMVMDGGGAEGSTLLSTDPTAVMYLKSDARVLPPSNQIKTALSLGTYGSFTDRFMRGDATWLGYNISYQLDEETDPARDQQIFLIDTDDDEVGDAPTHTDTISDPENFVSFVDRLQTNTSYDRYMAMSYDSSLPGPIVFPTVEQTICDAITNYRFDESSCYFAGYLPVQDLHKDPQDMLVIGTIHSGIDKTEFLGDTDDLSILGSKNTSQLRNKIFALVARYTLGQTGEGGTLDASMNPAVGGDFASLLGDRLLYAEGDTVISGSSSFLAKTLVVKGGDVYINGDISGDTLGLIVLSENGHGGNIYVDPSVRNIYANIFADGSIFSNSGVLANGVPQWANDEARIEALDSELYLRGSLISANTINGYADPYAASWNDGRGGETTDGDFAREIDLNLLRQARYCYEVSELTGAILPDTQTFCDGASGLDQLSDYHDGRSVDMQSFIVEYAPPPGSLPIFTSEPGAFN